MNSLRVFNRQAGFVITIAALLLGLVVPTIASAAQVTERSIELSSSSKAATGVTYTVKFTATGEAAAFVIDFCSDSPLIPSTCTAPSGFTLAGASTETAGYTINANSTASKLIVESALAEDEDVELVLEDVTNPTAAGSLYARIVTYDTAGHAEAYASGALGTGAVDSGSVAMNITDTIGVSAAVLESMVFCVSGATIPADCGSTTSTAITIGETAGSGKALVSNAISTGDIYAQISTNASGGAVVNLKSNALGCGGLLRAGAPSACDILPALDDGIVAGEAKFGVLVASSADTGSNPNGTFQAISGYNDTDYVLNFDDEEGTGVTSIYGDPILDTDGAPANNKNAKLTFGASVSNSTPAGLYSADLSLIATGKF